MRVVPTLYTPTLILRALTLEDAPTIFAYAHSVRVSRFTHWQRHITINDTKRFIKIHQPTALWGIVDGNTNELLGECGLLLPEEGIAEIHCALAPAYWGKGIARQALTTLIDFSCAEFNVTIQASIIADNQRSLRLARSLGMRHVFTMPTQWYAHGALRDVHVYRYE